MPERNTDLSTADVCLYPGECFALGSHEPFQCHTAEMAEELILTSEEVNQ